MAAEETEGPAEAGNDGQSDLDEVKRKFRAALDRKKEQHAAASTEGAEKSGKVHGTHGPASQRRSFRRKSGS